MRRVIALMSVLAVLGFAFAGPGGVGVHPANAAAGRVVKIGVDLPMSGGEAPNGVPTNNGVLLAIEQANKAGGPYTFEEVLKDDAVNGVHDPAQGAKNVQELVADSAVVGIVGNFNSNVGKASIPISNAAGVVQITPSQTNPTLTKGPDAKALRTKPNNYFRICSTDDLQGPVAADYAYKALKARKMAILDDTETYGKGIADEVEKEFKKLGGTVLSHDGIPKGTQDFHAILTKIKSENPDILFFGGVTTTGGGLVRKQMPDVGLKAAYEGGDGIVEDEFLKVAGDTAEGSYGTVAAIDATKIASAKAFLAAYKAKFNDDPGAYSASAYVAAKVIIDAVKAGGPDRAKVLAHVRALKGYKSILGTFGFDANGDTTNRVISVYVVKNGKWVWADQEIAQ
ncbi:MAG TPA: branched-chain amino acid ABC transporter substrate-binding protein [bacterium]|nr:branched-chain amino acid ABC transporter substrate-binding protein [bacterium]